MRKWLLFIMLCVCVVLMMPSIALAKDISPADGYNDHDFNKLQAFLEQLSADGVTKNGAVLNESYDLNDPATWTGVAWGEDPGKQVKSITGWNNKSLAGSLDLSGCTMLESLYCYNNSLVSVNVADCIALETLDCHSNDLTQLDVTSCCELVTLSCYDNELTDQLEAGGLYELKYLYFSDNNIEYIDISGSTKLELLDCSNNLIEGLSLDRYPSLKYIDCSNNLIESLDVSSCTALESLYCDYNSLVSLNASGCTKLKTLYCHHNSLVSLDLSNCTALTTLACTNNSLVSLDLSGLTALGSVFCNDNSLVSLDVSGCTALKVLNCYTNAIESLDISGLTSLESFYCYTNSLVSLDVSGFTALKTLNCSYNPLESLDVSECTALDNLMCINTNLESLDVSGLTALKQLGCENNELTSLNASGCLRLESLHCSDNDLVSLNVSGCTALKQLSCFNNNLISLDVSYCTGLVSLSCSNNELSGELNVSGFTALESLGCRNNELASLNISGCTALKRLYCDVNNIVSLNASGCTALELLHCYNNKLVSLDVSDCTALDELLCSSNPFKQLYATLNNSAIRLKAIGDGYVGIVLSSAYNIVATQSDYETFINWTDADGSVVSTSLSIPVGPDTVYDLTANFKCTVTFTSDGVEYTSRTVLPGASVGTGYWPPSPIKANYIFGGWWTGENGTGVEYTAATPITDTVTLYAKWTGDPYTVTFDPQGGTVNPSSKTVNYGGTYGTLPTPVRDGYSFDGWYTGTGGTGTKIESTTTVSITDGQTLYAKWTLKTFTVTFDAQGGSVNPSSKTVTYGGTYGPLPAPSRTGHIFGGWYTGRNGSGAKIESTTTVSITDNQTLYAKWITPVGFNYTKKDTTLYGGANGSITISAWGGNSGTYEYSVNGGTSWQRTNVFSYLAAGTYRVAVRDFANKSNAANKTVTIGQPAYKGSVSASKIPKKAYAGTALVVTPPSPPKGYKAVSVSYSSSKPSVAYIDAKGNLTFLAGGKATVITKLVSQMTDKYGRVKTKTTTVKKSVTVYQLVSSVSLNMNTAAITRTKKVKLTAAVAPSTASNKKVTWKSSNKKVATVSSSGTVTAKAVGTAVITCTARDGSGKSASCVVTVMPIYPTGVKISKTTLTLKKGKTYTLKATVLPKNTDFKTVTWSSSNTAVATIDAKGKVRGIAPGTAVITVRTSGGHIARCTVTVK